MGQDKCNRTWTIDFDLAERLKQTATALRVWDSDLVAVLLTHGLAELDAGRLKLARRPAWYTVKAEQEA